MSYVIKHIQSANQFATTVEDKISTLNYSVLHNGKTLDYTHTFVPEALRGLNIGQDLVKFALDYAKDNHFSIVPSCPFVKKYIDNHPEYASIVTKK